MGKASSITKYEAGKLPEQTVSRLQSIFIDITVSQFFDFGTNFYVESSEKAVCIDTDSQLFSDPSVYIMVRHYLVPAF